MLAPTLLTSLLLSALAVSPLLALASPRSIDAVTRSRYTKAHSLGTSYNFDPQDGWKSVNVSNLRYKYKRVDSWDEALVSNKGNESNPTTQPGRKREAAHRHLSKHTILTGPLKYIIGEISKVIKGFGTPQNAKITWYTGSDLQNPSCWANTKWAPTDESFACALTLNGWITRPKCFSFLELCNGPKKCVFVRVVDTCAGCAPGSKHIDLTKRAFTALADLDLGTLEITFRHATQPNVWYEDLWGPKE